MSDSERDDLHATIWRHRALASSPAYTVCACDRTWRPDADYRAHLADALIAAGFGDVTANPIRNGMRLQMVTIRTLRAERDALAAQGAAITALVAPQWRSIPQSAYVLEGTITAYIAGRNDAIDAVRAALVNTPAAEDGA